MLRTRLCEILRIEVPIIQAGMGPWSPPELAAAASNAGALGSLGGAMVPAERLKDQIERLRSMTERPFAVNFTSTGILEGALEVALEAHPPVISLALGDAGDMVKRAHDVGSLFVQQIHTVSQAQRAAENKVDVIIAQGTEAGGFGQWVSTMALVPQVVDAVTPIPVVAAGGIGNGRGLAAALVLGAQGVNMGTRFLASLEATVPNEWKQAIVSAQSEDAVKVEVWQDIFPKAATEGFGTVPRALRTPFIEEWQEKREDAKHEAERLQAQVGAAVQQGRMHEAVPFTGQSAGLVREVLPVAEIVRTLLSEAEQALDSAVGLKA